MNTFYKKLTRFGSLVHNTSREKNVDIANYFTVMHPAFPVADDTEIEPDILFAEKCPRTVKREVKMLWQTVFGKAS